MPHGTRSGPTHAGHGLQRYPPGSGRNAAGGLKDGERPAYLSAPPGRGMFRSPVTPGWRPRFPHAGPRPTVLSTHVGLGMFRGWLVAWAGRPPPLPAARLPAVAARGQAAEIAAADVLNESFRAREVLNDSFKTSRHVLDAAGGRSSGVVDESFTTPWVARPGRAGAGRAGAGRGGPGWGGAGRAGLGRGGAGRAGAGRGGPGWGGAGRGGAGRGASVTPAAPLARVGPGACRAASVTQRRPLARAGPGGPG